MRLFTFIMGGIVGVALFCYIMSISGYDIVRKQSVVFPILNKENVSPKVHYFTVNGPKGEVTLNTEMKRDSVRILLGKPSSTDFQALGESSSETWKYEFTGRDYSVRILTVNFENEKVESVREY